MKPETMPALPQAICLLDAIFSPRAVALVHGDQDARVALAARLRDQAEVYLPEDGMAITVRARQNAPRWASGQPVADYALELSEDGQQWRSVHTVHASNARKLSNSITL